jgi:serine/threonine protein kinase
VLLDLGAMTPDGRVYGRHDAPGTTAYMPPELLDDGVVTAACDVFALGVTLRELLAEAPALPVLDDLLALMTSVDPARRPSDDEVLQVLHGELGGAGSSLWPTWAGALLHPR